MAAKISNYQVVDLSPVIKTKDKDKGIDKQFESLCKPIILKTTQVEFEVNCSSSIANAIRRVISGELLLKYMTSEYEQISTDDRFIIPEMIQERIKMIPMLQTVPEKTTFRLRVTNNSPNNYAVLSSELIASDGKKYFDMNIPLLYLMPGTFIHVDAQIASAYTWQEGMVSAASQASSTAVGVTIVNELESNAGARSSNSSPMLHKISFINFGLMSDKEMLTRTCKTIIERLEIMRESLHMITGVNNEFTLLLKGESDTIGNMIIQEGFTRYPSLKYLTYQTSPDSRQVIIKISTEEPHSILKDVIKHCIDVVSSIMASI